MRSPWGGRRRVRGLPSRVIQQAIKWQKQGKEFFTLKGMCDALGYRYELYRQRIAVYNALKAASSIGFVSELWERFLQTEEYHKEKRKGATDGELWRRFIISANSRNYYVYISLPARGQSSIKHVYFQPSSLQRFEEYRQMMLIRKSKAITDEIGIQILLGDFLKLPSGESIKNLPLIRQKQLVKTIDLLSTLGGISPTKKDALLENLLGKPAEQLRLVPEKVFLCPYCQKPMRRDSDGNLECPKCGLDIPAYQVEEMKKSTEEKSR